MRLFIALDASEFSRGYLLAACKKLRTNFDQQQISTKWSPIENHHITLIFLGERQESGVDGIFSCMRVIAERTPSFDLKIEGIGGFPDDRHARVVYAGVQNKIALRELVTGLANELLSHSLLAQLPENYQPHLTLGRLRNPRSIEDAISPLVRTSFGKLSALRISLYKSDLQGAFPVYTCLCSADLAAKDNSATNENS